MRSINVRETLRKYDLRLTKSLGQNFLTSNEIGPGVGSMTASLAEAAGHVIAIEIDKHLIPALQNNLEGYGNIEIINEDVLKLNIRELISRAVDRTGLQKVKVAANLPYYITTPIIMKLLEEEPGISSMIFMVQKEVAMRMAANPGKKDYGALSVAVQYYSDPVRVMDVPPHCFVPQPEVDSSVIRLDIHERPPVELKDRPLFFKVIKAAFGQRRKTLLNALFNSNFFGLDKEQIRQILSEAGIGENQRGETLSIHQFAELSNLISDRLISA